MTSADVLLYRQAVAEGGSNLRVRAGEVLTERDLLLALLLPSADNIAETLAVWVSGNRSAFIARLNATAAALGMHAHPFRRSERPQRQNGLDCSRSCRAREGGDRQPGARRTWWEPRRLASRRHHAQEPRHPAQPAGGMAGHQDRLDRSGRRLPALRRPNACTTPVRSSWCGAPCSGQPPAAAGDPAHPELGQAFASAQQAVSAADRCLRCGRSRRVRPAGLGVGDNALGGQRPRDAVADGNH